MHRRTRLILALACFLAFVLTAAVLWFRPRDRCGAPVPASAVRSPTLPVDDDRPEAQPVPRSRPRARPPSEGGDSAEASRVDPGRVTQESVDIVEATGPSFELVRSTLASAIELHLPGLDLSSAALDELSDATLRMRRAQDSLRAIPKTPEHSHQRSRTRRSLENAIADFTRIATMTPAEFTRLVQSDVGIDEPAVDGPAIDLSIRPLDAANGSE